MVVAVGGVCYGVVDAACWQHQLPTATAAIDRGLRISYCNKAGMRIIRYVSVKLVVAPLRLMMRNENKPHAHSNLWSCRFYVVDRIHARPSHKEITDVRIKMTDCIIPKWA